MPDKRSEQRKKEDDHLAYLLRLRKNYRKRLAGKEGKDFFRKDKLRQVLSDTENDIIKNVEGKK